MELREQLLIDRLTVSKLLDRSQDEISDFRHVAKMCVASDGFSINDELQASLPPDSTYVYAGRLTVVSQRTTTPLYIRLNGAKVDSLVAEDTEGVTREYVIFDTVICSGQINFTFVGTRLRINNI